MNASVKVVPELLVADLDVSFEFYVHVLGFTVGYARPEERFAFLDLDGAGVMLQEMRAAPRRLITAPIERPFGRGATLQLNVADVDALIAKLTAAGHVPIVPIEERWLRAGSTWIGQRQFVIGDPDGYLLRFARSLGVKS